MNLSPHLLCVSSGRCCGRRPKVHKRYLLLLPNIIFYAVKESGVEVFVYIEKTSNKKTKSSRLPDISMGRRGLCNDHLKLVDGEEEGLWTLDTTGRLVE